MMIYPQSLNVEQAQAQMIPVLKGPPIRCALCGREFQRISPGHLAVHRDYLHAKRGIKWFKQKKARLNPNPSTDETETEIEWEEEWQFRDETLIEVYERLFGGKDELHACVQKIFTLYQPHRAKWLLMDKPIAPRYATWYEVSADNPNFRPNRLCLSILKEHLLLKCTIGVFPKSRYKTHFVTWDVDAASLPDNPSWNPLTEAQRGVRAITSVLRRWGLHPHVMISGSKGYHVTVFFTEAISVKISMNLYKAVLQHPHGPECGPGLKVECLPIQRGNKLPLGISWKSGVFCGFVDPYTLDSMGNPYEYLLEIIPDSPSILWQIVDNDRAVKRIASTVIEDKSWNIDATESAYKVGVVAPGTRHDTLLRVAAYVRNTPSLCPESFLEFVDILTQWSTQQYERNRANIKTGWEEHLRDLDRVARYVWLHPLTAGIPRVIRVTTGAVHWIRAQTQVLAEQQLLFLAWYELELVGEHFYLGYLQAQEMTGLAKDSLDNSFKALRDKRILVVTKEYYHATKGIVPSRTRQYRFASPPDDKSVNATLLTMEPEDWDSNLWFRLLRTLFSEADLKRWYPFAYHRILKARPVVLGRSSA